MNFRSGLNSRFSCYSFWLLGSFLSTCDRKSHPSLCTIVSLLSESQLWRISGESLGAVAERMSSSGFLVS